MSGFDAKFKDEKIQLSRSAINVLNFWKYYNEIIDLEIINSFNQLFMKYLKRIS